MVVVVDVVVGSFPDEGGEVVVVVDVVVGGGIKVILHSKLSDKPISSKATPLTVPVVPVPSK